MNKITKENKQKKANYEIRIYNKDTKKTKLISINTKLNHEKLREKITKSISEISEISRTGLWYRSNK